jgi:D-aminopeptidase
MNRARIRELGIKIGTYPTGPHNAITDVAGVLVGQVTVIHDEPTIARTGITVIAPREGAIGNDYAFAGFHRFNGCGEMTGTHWLEETGLLTSAIGLTNTHQVGMVRDALAEFSFTHAHFGAFYLPVVTETYDGWLNDMNALHLTKEQVFDAMSTIKGGAVDEGNVGGGTGMICHEFKGGIGTSSRLVETRSGTDQVPSPWQAPPQSSSIVVVIATDAPLLGDQCKRLAQRATSGLARVGGVGQNTSGDLFLAFATGHHIPAAADGPIPLSVMIPHNHLNPFFEATADAVEESILNALAAAETMTGCQGHIAYALPLDELQRVMKKYRRLE